MNKIFGEKMPHLHLYSSLQFIYKHATVKEILYEQGFREGDKEGQTVPGPRGLVGVS